MALAIWLRAAKQRYNCSLRFPSLLLLSSLENAMVENGDGKPIYSLYSSSAVFVFFCFFFCRYTLQLRMREIVPQNSRHAGHFVMEILSEQVRLLIGNFSRVLEDGSPSLDGIESLIVGAERVQHILVTLVDSIPGIVPLIELVVHTLNNIADIIDTAPSAYGAHYLYSP